MTLRRTPLLLASAVLALASCSSGPASTPAPAEAKHNAAAYDSLDVCGLATAEQYQAALGEEPASPERRDADGLKACAVDAKPGGFYLFLTVVRPSLAPADQVAFDRAGTEGAQDAGTNVFSFADSDQAFVEGVAGDLVVRVALVYYVESGTLTDGPAVVGRLRTLLGQVTQKVQ